MTIALFLLPYALFLLFFIFFSLAALFHMVKFGVKNLITFVATFLFIAISVIILFVSFTALQNIEWSTPIFEGFSITLPTS